MGVQLTMGVAVNGLFFKLEVVDRLLPFSGLELLEMRFFGKGILLQLLSKRLSCFFKRNFVELILKYAAGLFGLDGGGFPISLSDVGVSERDFADIAFCVEQNGGSLLLVSYGYAVRCELEVIS